MSVMLDLAVVLILGLSVVLGWKRGFVKTLIKFAGSLISLVAAVVLATPLSVFINDLFVADWISGIARGALAEQLSAIGNDFSTLFSQMPEGFQSLINRFGITQDDAQRQYEQMAAENKTDGLITEELSDYISAGAAEAVSYAIAFLVLYIAFYFVLKLVTKLIDPIFHLPLLHGANATLGALLGLLIGVVFLWILALLVEHLAPYLSETDSVFSSGFSAENTLLYQFFAEANPLRSII